MNRPPSEKLPRLRRGSRPRKGRGNSVYSAATARAGERPRPPSRFVRGEVRPPLRARRGPDAEVAEPADHITRQGSARASAASGPDRREAEASSEWLPNPPDCAGNSAPSGFAVTCCYGAPE
jgi:hypothetical protein